MAAHDVVILPAFGVTVSDLEQLERRGCTLVDTTCGSVLNVWKNVRQYARDGFTAVIHGKARHEETQATASQVLAAGGGAYLIVLDRDEAAEVCTYIGGRGDRARFVARFDSACSPGFDPDRDLRRVGLANQTTMLMSESLAIGEMFRQALGDRYGAASLEKHYRAFDTICSATQDRQDAVRMLLDERAFEIVIVIGGYNSSNTRNLARICAERAPTYHIAGPSCLVSRDRIRHLQPANGPEGRPREVAANGWLPPRRSAGRRSDGGRIDARQHRGTGRDATGRAGWGRVNATRPPAVSRYERGAPARPRGCEAARQSEARETGRCARRDGAADRGSLSPPWRSWRLRRRTPRGRNATSGGSRTP